MYARINVGFKKVTNSSCDLNEGEHFTCRVGGERAGGGGCYVTPGASYEMERAEKQGEDTTR